MVVEIPGDCSSHVGPGGREPDGFKQLGYGLQKSSPSALLPPGRLHCLKGPQSIIQMMSTQQVSLQGILKIQAITRTWPSQQQENMQKMSVFSARFFKKWGCSGKAPKQMNSIKLGPCQGVMVPLHCILQTAMRTLLNASNQ